MVAMLPLFSYHKKQQKKIGGESHGLRIIAYCKEEQLSAGTTVMLEQVKIIPLKRFRRLVQ